MPYYITKDIINKQICNILVHANASFEIINQVSDDLNSNSLTLFNNSENLLCLESLTIDKGDIEDIIDLLFQLKDYQYYLGYVLQLLLTTKHYELVCILFNKIFVNHIGDCYYVSKDYSYELNERYFDRFIEAIMFCKIDFFKVLPFLFAIYFSDSNSIMFKWIRPCNEFLKYFISQNEGTFLNFINNEEFYKKGYKIYGNLFPEKCATKLIENYINEDYFNKEDLYELFLQLKEDGVNVLKEYIINKNLEIQKTVLNFYLNFGGDVKTTLPELYEKVTNSELKNLIKDEIDLNKNIKFNTIKEFIDFATLNATNIESNLIEDDNVLLFFKNGVKVSNDVLNYIYFMFKNISSPSIINKYKYLLDFFTQNELNNLGLNLLEKLNNKLNDNNKWIVALISTLCSDEIIDRVVAYVPSVLENSDLLSFVLGCLSQTKNAQVVSLIKQLYIDSDNKNFYFHFLENLADCAGISALDYLDEMVSNYGLDENAERKIMCNGENLLLQISNNLRVQVKNLDTLEYVNLVKTDFDEENNVQILYENLVNEIRLQIEKFKEAFYNKRVWSIVSFKANILTNPILRKIANSLVFGIYDKDKFIEILNFNEIDNVNNNYKIGLVHPIELNEEEYKNLVGKFEPFNQINRKIFLIDNCDFSNYSCTQFNGVAISDLSFNAKIRTYGYKMNTKNEVYYYKTYPKYNILVTIDIIKTKEKNVSILNNIKFYNLNMVEQVQNKYMLNSMALEKVGSINNKLYSNVLNEIFESCYH